MWHCCTGEEGEGGYAPDDIRSGSTPRRGIAHGVALAPALLSTSLSLHSPPMVRGAGCLRRLYILTLLPKSQEAFLSLAHTGTSSPCLPRQATAPVPSWAFLAGWSTRLKHSGGLVFDASCLMLCTISESSSEADTETISEPSQRACLDRPFL